MPPRRGPGRPSLGDKALTCHADVRMSKAQHAAYHAAGGADWFRAKLWVGGKPKHDNG